LTFEANGGTPATQGAEGWATQPWANVQNPTNVTPPTGWALDIQPGGNATNSGWFTTAAWTGGDLRPTTGTVPNIGDIFHHTFFARWRRDITFNTGSFTVTNNNSTTGSGATRTQTVRRGQPWNTVVAPTLQTPAGTTFLGWWTVNAPTGGTQLPQTVNPISGGIADVAGSLQFWPRFTRTMVFNANGGTGGGNVTVGIGETWTAVRGRIPTTTAPAGSGFTLGGWFSVNTWNGGTELPNSGTVPANHAVWTYFARWTRTATFNPNGGTLSGNTATQTVTVTRGQPWNQVLTTANLTLAAPAGGWSLVNWFTTASWTGGTPLPTGNVGDTGPWAWHARWTRQMTFQGNGDAGFPATPATTNVNIFLHQPWSDVGRPTVVRYPFLPLGWFDTAADPGNAWPTTGNIAANSAMTWHMRWERNPDLWQWITFHGGGQIRWPNNSVPNGQVMGTPTPFEQDRELVRSGTFAQALNGNPAWGVAQIQTPVRYMEVRHQMVPGVGPWLDLGVREYFEFIGWFQNATTTNAADQVTATISVLPPDLRYRVPNVYAQWRQTGLPFYHPTQPSWFGCREMGQVVAERFGRNYYHLVSEAALNALPGNIIGTNRGIQNVIGAQHLHNISLMQLGNNSISDIAPLAGLTAHGNLHTLNLNNNLLAGATALSPLSGMHSLNTLSVNNNRLTSIAPLSGLNTLLHLHVTGNRNLVEPVGIVDLGPVSTMTSLQTLSASQNSIENLAPLSGMVTLQTLSLNDNLIVNLAPLSNLNLGTLELSDNRIVDISPLETVQSIVSLAIARNHIFDISPANAFWNVTVIYATGQTIRLEDVIERTDTIVIPNIVVGLNGALVAPNAFVPAGATYASPLITWTNMNFGLLEVNYSWFTPIGGSVTGFFSGTVTQPLVEYVNIVLRGNGGLPYQQLRRAPVGSPYSVVFNPPTVEPTRPGYTFAGWWTNYIGGERVMPDDIIQLMPWPTQTLFARWTWNGPGDPTEQVVTFRGNGGTPNLQTAVVTINAPYGAALTSAGNAISRPNHTFAGWWTSPVGGERVVATDIVTDASARVLYAQWTFVGPDPHQRVEFRGNGGYMAVQFATVPWGAEYGDAFVQIEQPTRRYWEFMGWYTTQQTGTGVEVTETCIVTSATSRILWARWRWVGPGDGPWQTITFHGNGGHPSMQVTAAVVGTPYGNAFNSIIEPYWSMGTFMGWFTAPVGGAQVEPGHLVTASSYRDLFAQWDTHEGVQTVRFVGNGGEPALQFAAVEIDNTTYAAAFAQVMEPTRAGYTFLGWFNQRVGGYEVLDTHPITSGRVRTLFAQWEWDGDTTQRTQVVTFYGNGAPAPYDFRQGTAAFPGTYMSLIGPTGSISNPVRDGYIFLGWWTDAIGGTQVQPGDAVTDAPTRALFARWQLASGTYPPPLTVIFRGNGGGPAVQAVETDRIGTFAHALANAEVPTREGHTFLGWATAPVGGQLVQDITPIPLTGAMTITLWARWSDYTGFAEVQTVTFRANGGGPDWQTATIYIGQAYDPIALAQIEQPTRHNYIFLGWYTTPMGVGERLEPGMLASGGATRTFYARWQIIDDTQLRHRIEFIGNNGSPAWQVAYSPVDELFGHAMNQVSEPIRPPMHIFVGWYTTPTEGTGQRVNPTDPFFLHLPAGIPSTMRVYARWEIDDVPMQVVTFASNGTLDRPATPDVQIGLVPRGVGSNYGVAMDQIIVPPVRPGYEFAGWWTTASGPGTEILSTTLLRNDNALYSVVHARWTLAGSGGQHVRYWVPTGVPALWREDTIPATEMFYGPSFGRVGVPTHPEGRIFRGWFTQMEGGQRVLAADLVTSAAERDLWAQWWPDGPYGPNQQNVIFYGNGGLPFRQVAEVLEGMPYEWAFEQVVQPTREDHTFVGWFTNPIGGDRVYGTCLVTWHPERLLFAQWTYNGPDPNPYQTITFRGNGGHWNAGTPVETDWAFTVVERPTNYGTAFTAVGQPTRPGFTFAGWFTWYEGGQQIFPNMPVTDAPTRTLYAQWNRVGVNPEQTVVFHGNGGGPTPQFATVLRNFDQYSAAFAQVQEPTRNGFVFRGWYTEHIGGTRVTGTMFVTNVERRELFAQWDECPDYPPYPPVQTVTFRGNGGHPDFQVATVPMSGPNATYATAFAQVEIPTRANHTFAGWWSDPIGGFEITETMAVTGGENRIVHAQWTQNEPEPRVQTITFRGNGGSLDLQTRTAVVGQPYGNVFATVTVTRDGYEFIGWFTGHAMGGNRIFPEDIVTDAPERVLYAWWRATTPRQEQVVTFLGMGGYPVHQTRTIINPVIGVTTYGPTMATVITPESGIAGVTFRGWYDAPVGGNPVTAATLVTNAPVRNIYAQWTFNPNTHIQVIFDANGGAPTPQATFVAVGTQFGTARGNVLEPTRRGFDKTGWFNTQLGGAAILDGEVLAAVPGGTRIVYAQWVRNDEPGQLISFIANHPQGTVGVPLIQEVMMYFDRTYGDAMLEVLTPWDTTGGMEFYRWWQTQARVPGGELLASTPITSDPMRNIWGQWNTAGMIELVFYGAGGTPERQTRLVEPGSDYAAAIAAITPVSRLPHYSFIGWFDAPQGSVSVVPNQITSGPVTAASAHTLWAHWNRTTGPDPVIQTIHFMGNGGMPVYQVREINPVVLGTTTYAATFATVIEPPHPTNPNFTFRGWYTMPVGGVRVEASDLVTAAANRVLYAQWNDDGGDRQWVIFMGNNGTPDEQIVYVTRPGTYQAALDQITEPTRTDYRFLGWFDTWLIPATRLLGTDAVTNELGSIWFAHWRYGSVDGIYIIVDEDGNHTVSVPDGMTYQSRWEGDNDRLVVTFPPDSEGIDITTILPPLPPGRDPNTWWRYSGPTTDAGGNRVVTIYPPTDWTPPCDGDCNIYIVVDEDGRVNVTVPPCVDWHYVEEDEDGNIVVRFPEDTNEDRIYTMVPPGWEYVIVRCPDYDHVLVVITPPRREQNLIFRANGGTWPLVAAQPTWTADMRTTVAYVGTPYQDAFNAVMPYPQRTGYTFAGWFSDYIDGSTEVLGTDPVTAISTRTLFAHWTRDGGGDPTEQVITFRGNGGDPDFQTQVAPIVGGTYAAAFAAVTTPTMDGHTFNGWWTTPAGAGDQVFGFDTVTNEAARTLYARWTRTDARLWQTIEFMGNGGWRDEQFATVQRNAGVTYGAAFDMIEEPTRAGYVFRGWFTASAGGTQVQRGDAVTNVERITLWAQWRPDTGAGDITIVVDGDGNTTITVPPGMGYDYRWEGDNDRLVVTFPPDSEGLDITTILPPLPPGVAPEDWWRYSGPTTDAGGNRVVTIYPPPGWTPPCDGDCSIYITKTPDGTVTVTVPPCVEWYIVGEDEEGHITVTFPEDTDPGRIIYNLPPGWTYRTHVDEDGHLVVTLLPPGTPGQQRLTFRGNGGAWDPTIRWPQADLRTTYATVGTPHELAFATVGEPERDGYTFAGWFSDYMAGSDRVFATDLVTEIPHRTLFAHWTRNAGNTDPERQVITFRGNGGLPEFQTAVVTANEGNYAAAFAQIVHPPTKAGHTFAGWWTTPAVGGAQIEATTLVSGALTLTLYARWTPISDGRLWQTVEFMGNYGYRYEQFATVQRGAGVQYGAAFDQIEEPTRAGWIFLGWNTEPDGTGTPIERTTPVNNDPRRTFWAQWERDGDGEQTLIFRANGGAWATNPQPTWTADMRYTVAEWGTPYQAAFDAVAPIPTRDGYTFLGWFSDYVDGELVRGTDLVTAIPVRTLFAQWRWDGTGTDPNQVITFRGNGGTPELQTAVVTAGTGTYGAAIGQVEQPTKAGHTFAGWWTAPVGGTQIINTTPVSGDLTRTLYAQWTRIPTDTREWQTIEFMGNGGYRYEQFATIQRNATVPYTYGDAFDMIEQPTRMGFNFLGWNTAQDGSGTMVARTTAVSNEARIILWAQWERTGNIYVTVDEDGNTTITVPPGMGYDYERDSDGNIIVTFPPGDEDIIVNVPDDWTYDIYVRDDGYRIVTITPPDEWTPPCDGDCNIYITKDEDGTVTVTIPPCVEWYRVGEDDEGNITVTFPPGTDYNRIVYDLPPDWTYRVDICEETDEVIITLLPPGTIGESILIAFHPGFGTNFPEYGTAPRNQNFRWVMNNLAPTFTQPGYIFDGWNFVNGANTLQEEVNPAKRVLGAERVPVSPFFTGQAYLLVATWRPAGPYEDWTVRFYNNFGMGEVHNGLGAVRIVPASTTETFGELLARIAPTARPSGYEFLRWSLVYTAGGPNAATVATGISNWPVVAVIEALGTDGELSLFAQWVEGTTIQYGDRVIVFFTAADGSLRTHTGYFYWYGTRTYGSVVSAYNPYDGTYPDNNVAADWSASNGQPFSFWSFDEAGTDPVSAAWHDIALTRIVYVEPGGGSPVGRWVLTVVAQWGEPDRVDRIFVRTDIGTPDTIVDTVEVTVGAEYGTYFLPANHAGMERTGYVLTGWFEAPQEAAGTPVRVIPTAAIQNVDGRRLYAHWQRADEQTAVVVYFHPNRAGATLTVGASVPTEWTVTTVSGSERFVVPANTNLGVVAGHVTTTPAAPAFRGWSLLPNGAVMTAAELTAFLLNTAGTVHLFAQWTEMTDPVAVDVIFHGNGGVWNPGAVEAQTEYNVAVGTLLSAILPAVPTHEDGYDFLGWSLLETGAVIANPAMFPMIGPGPVEFHAQWDTDGRVVPTVIVNFHPNRVGATVSTLGVDPANLPDGWDATQTTTGVNTGMWTFTLPAGTILGEVAAVIDAQPADEFLGWSRELVGAPLPFFYPLTAATTTLRAQWDTDDREVPQVTIRFNATDGVFPTGTVLNPLPVAPNYDEIVTMTVDAGTLLALVPVVQPSHSDYTFLGWGAFRVSPPLAWSTVVVNNSTYFAQWNREVETVNVTFDANVIGGTFPNGQRTVTIAVPVTMTFGEALTAFAAQLTITHPDGQPFGGLWTDFAGAGGNNIPLDDLVTTSTWFAQWGGRDFLVFALYSEVSAYLPRDAWVMQVPRFQTNGDPMTYGAALALAIAHFALPENGGYDLAALVHENETYPFWGWGWLDSDDEPEFDPNRVITDWYATVTGMWNDVRSVLVAFNSADEDLGHGFPDRGRAFMVRAGTLWTDVLDPVHGIAPSSDWAFSSCGNYEFAGWILVQGAPGAANGRVSPTGVFYEWQAEWIPIAP